MRDTILCGDALATLKTIPSNHVQTCVTSPPYYSLRDYGVEGQIGLEDTPEAYIARLVEVFREVRRVLRPDGTLWVNIGDSYAGSGKGADGKQEYLGINILRNNPIVPQDCKPKDLIGIPWMLAFALRADGWYLRSDVIWHKPNAMPESVTDRPTSAHEHVFLLAKRERYFYDAQAVKEPVTGNTHSRGPKPHDMPKTVEMGKGIKNNVSFTAATWDRVSERNKRNVWSIPSSPYSEAHFATFPPKLIEPCILAGTSPKACEVCGAAWERVVVSTGHVNKREPAHAPHNCPTKTDSTGWAHTKRATDNWQPTCTHPNDGTAKCIVLDPFMGAGTTALVALQHNRSYLGIELNPAYCDLIRERIAEIQPELWSA